MQTMVVTPEILNQVIAWSVRRTANKLNVAPDDDCPTMDEMLDAIGATSPAHMDALREFATAYLDWWEFHFRIALANRQKQMTPQETMQLNGLIDNRDATRKALLAIT